MNLNRKPIAIALIATLLASAAPAFAEIEGDREIDRNPHGNIVNGRPYYETQQRPAPEWRGNRGRVEQRGRDNGQRQHARGAGPHHDIYAGHRLPREYYQPRYVVNDWRGRHLSAPPRGYHWVQTGSDYALVAIATGVVLSILLNN